MSCTPIKRKYVLPNLVTDLLKDLESHYVKEQKFSEDVLKSLHSIMGKVVVESLDLLEFGKFVEYTTETNHKRVFKVSEKNNSYYLFDAISYCSCDEFKEVFNCTSITCKHLLALNFAKCKGVIKKETLTDVQLTDLLNSQIESCTD